jgi:hypothetical protein
MAGKSPIPFQGGVIFESSQNLQISMDFNLLNVILREI